MSIKNRIYGGLFVYAVSSFFSIPICLCIYARNPFGALIAYLFVSWIEFCFGFLISGD